MQTAADHQATVAAREEELKVIAQARKILTDTSSGAVEQTYSLLQMKMNTRADLAGAEVVTLVISFGFMGICLQFTQYEALYNNYCCRVLGQQCRSFKFLARQCLYQCTVIAKER